MRVDVSGDKVAKGLLKKGLTVYSARFGVTVKSVIDVTPSSGEWVFVSIECQGRVRHTEARLAANGEERFEFGEELELFALLGRREVRLQDIEEGRDGRREEGFQDCIATFALCEVGMDERIRDYGSINMTDFVCRMGMTEKRVEMKLGGCVDVVIECSLRKWEETGLKDSEYENKEVTSEAWQAVSSASLVILEEHNEAPKITREYGELYKTRCTGGEWSEYPVITTISMSSKQRIELWSIEGPTELYDDGLDTSDSKRFMKRHVACQDEEAAKCGRMSRLQKLRGWAHVPLVVGGVCEMERLFVGLEKRVSDCTVDCEDDGKEEI